MDAFGRDRPREEAGRRDRSRSRDREDGGRGGEQPKAKLSKSELDEARKERLAMVKRLTGETDEAETAAAAAAAVAADGLPAADEEEDEEAEMRRVLGISGFDTTKGKAVEDNHHGAGAGGMAKHKARKYRQYMNRKGGFNRPLDKIA